MDEIEKLFKDSVKNKNIDTINDVLIKASKQPEKRYLDYIDFLIDKASKIMLEKTKLNLIYLLGEIGKNSKLANKYLDFLHQGYFNSDRWIRNEIIQTFSKIAEKNKFTPNIIKIFAYALVEDYLPTKLNALNAVKKLDSLSDLIIENLLKILDNSNQKIVDLTIDILKIHIKNPQMLFNILDSTEKYKLLGKNSIRVILISFFDSIIKLETFRKRIIESEWLEKYKIMFCNEIDIYQKILEKRI